MLPSLAGRVKCKDLMLRSMRVLNMCFTEETIRGITSPAPGNGEMGEFLLLL